MSLDVEKIAEIAVASVPDLLKAIAAIAALAKKGGASDEQIRAALEPAARAEVKRIAEQQAEDERDEEMQFPEHGTYGPLRTSNDAKPPADE